MSETVKPNHYLGMDEKTQVEDVLRNFIPFYTDSYVAHRVASAVEYLLRAPRKNRVEDIKKARENLNQILEYLGATE